MKNMTKEEQYDPLKKLSRKEDPLEVIAELLKGKGIDRFALITMDWEGNTLPGGTPTESGEILTDKGKVFRFWLDWDPTKVSPDGTQGWYTLGEERMFFSEIDPLRDRYPTDKSYLRARKELDLPLTQEQERILREENT